MNDRFRYACLAGLAFAAVGTALVSQHVFDMQPCPWCVVQRMIYFVVGFVAAVAWAWPGEQGGSVHRNLSLLIAALATLGAASALWQQLYAAKSSSCAMTAADLIIRMSRLDVLLPEIFQARASCAESASMLGVPYALWSLTAFIIVAAGAGWLHLEQRQRGSHDGPPLGGVTA
jgi:protein dithiol:quinone oxidoreductase